MPPRKTIKAAVPRRGIRVTRPALSEGRSKADQPKAEQPKTPTYADVETVLKYSTHDAKERKERLDSWNEKFYGLADEEQVKLLKGWAGLDLVSLRNKAMNWIKK